MSRVVQGQPNQVKWKAKTVALFAYGMVVGTSAPFFLSRCIGGGVTCGACGGLCAMAAASALPLVLYFTLRSRIKGAGRQALSFLRRMGGR